jgi:hypothetical protein
MSRTKTTHIGQDVIMAATLMVAFSTSGQGSVEDISSLLFKLKNAGVELGDISLRKVPGGFYSEDIAVLIRRYLAAGYAEQMSLIRLTGKGRQLLAEIIGDAREENPSALQQIEAVLGPLTG